MPKPTPSQLSDTQTPPVSHELKTTEKRRLTRFKHMNPGPRFESPRNPRLKRKLALSLSFFTITKEGEI
jgi:hypothetical protein